MSTESAFRNEPVARSDPRWIPVAALYLFTAVWAVAQVFAGDSGALSLLASITFALFLTTWVVMDGRQRGRPILHIVQLIFFLTWSVSVPLYLILTRGTRGLAWVALHAVGLFVVACVFFVGTIMLVWGPAALVGN